MYSIFIKIKNGLVQTDIRMRKNASEKNKNFKHILTVTAKKLQLKMLN